MLARAQRTIYLHADEGPIAEATQEITLESDEKATVIGSPVLATQYGPSPDAEFLTRVLFAKTKNSNGEDVFAYFHHDHIGTPLQATDKAGRVVWAASYNAFGQATITTPPATATAPTIVSTMRLAGQVEDAETGLHYNYRRYYDPSTGRYITQDPIGAEGGNNKYRYAEADPVNLTDPTGECPMCVGYAVCVASCMLEDAASNALMGDCNNFGDSAKGCALSCLLGPLGKLGKLGKVVKKTDCPGNSFTADTMVHVRPQGAADGDAAAAATVLKPISQLQVGDEVLAFSEWKTKGAKARSDERLSYEKVTDVFTSFKRQKLVHLVLDNGATLSATEGHPFLTSEGWRDAVMLKKGGQLMLKAADGDAGPLVQTAIIDVRVEYKTLPAFNLEVANAHTFMVGVDGTVVHNGFGSYTCYFKSGKRYHGKGDYKRAQDSAKARGPGTKTNDEIDHIDWKPEANDADSFRAEAERIRRDGGITNPDNYNKINSPRQK